MCDYSLMHEPNRLAQAGETLTLHMFSLGSLGFANAEELENPKPRPFRQHPLLGWLLMGFNAGASLLNLFLFAFTRAHPWLSLVAAVFCAAVAAAVYLSPEPPNASRSHVCAICVPPGARLLLSGIPERLRERYGVAVTEAVTFVQLHADVNRYRDGVRFSNGETVLLQDLEPGQCAQVLSLGEAADEQELQEVRLGQSRRQAVL